MMLRLSLPRISAPPARLDLARFVVWAPRIRFGSVGTGRPGGERPKISQVLKGTRSRVLSVVHWRGILFAYGWYWRNFPGRRGM